ncbi:MAG: hypothetical protein FJX20_01745 [Alphaproteobacteria bacterium]|nr:hypothetical protein [Alphaproteobacteria bacterium]
MRVHIAAALLLAIVGCQPAPTPSRDVAYCEELFAIHERYLLPRGFDGNDRRDPRADLAVDLCRRGRTQEGIPILEDRLRRARWPLPER